MTRKIQQFLGSTSKELARVVDAPLETAEMIDLPRWCAIHDKPYLASYGHGPDGLFTFDKSVRVNLGTTVEVRGEWVRLAPEDMNPLGPNECCAWCGKQALLVNGVRITSVRCYACNSFVCLGRARIERSSVYESSSEYVTSSGFSGNEFSYSSSYRSQSGFRDTEQLWFRCRPSCGHSAEVSGNWVESEGVLRRGLR